jgi:hypothetical protein
MDFEIEHVLDELQEAVTLFEMDPRCQEVGTDEWVWLQRATIVLNNAAGEPLPYLGDVVVNDEPVDIESFLGIPRVGGCYGMSSDAIAQMGPGGKFYFEADFIPVPDSKEYFDRCAAEIKAAAIRDIRWDRQREAAAKLAKDGRVAQSITEEFESRSAETNLTILKNRSIGKTDVKFAPLPEFEIEITECNAPSRKLEGTWTCDGIVSMTIIPDIYENARTPETNDDILFGAIEKEVKC